MAYAILSSAMPRAGGSYIYTSRGLHPYLGFVASFSQWFGLSIVIGVIAYVIVPLFRDIAAALGWSDLVVTLETGIVRVSLALLMIRVFVWGKCGSTPLFASAITARQPSLARGGARLIGYKQ